MMNDLFDAPAAREATPDRFPSLSADTQERFYEMDKRNLSYWWVEPMLLPASLLNAAGQEAPMAKAYISDNMDGTMGCEEALSIGSHLYIRLSAATHSHEWRYTIARLVPRDEWNDEIVTYKEAVERGWRIWQESLHGDGPERACEHNRRDGIPVRYRNKEYVIGQHYWLMPDDCLMAHELAAH